jgi:RHS repeat-associated protein
MSTHQLHLLCHYHYDPLDRLIGHAQPGSQGQQRFYCKSRLATEVQGDKRHSIFQQGDLLLAQRHCEGEVADTALFCTDSQRSLLNTLEKDHSPHSFAYSPYGHHRAESGLSRVLGFNGERPDFLTGHYLLGNGYRAFNPVLMRFNSPDSWSPFGKGGMNAYVYCAGNPIGRTDPTGHFLVSVMKALNLLPTGTQGKFIGYYVGARAPLTGLENGSKLSGAAMHADGARLGQGLYVTSDARLAETFLNRAGRDSGTQIFGVHHNGEFKVRQYGLGLHPDADMQAIAQSDKTFRIPNTQYDNLIFTEWPSASPVSPALTSPSSSAPPGIAVPLRPQPSANPSSAVRRVRSIANRTAEMRDSTSRAEAGFNHIGRMGVRVGDLRGMSQQELRQLDLW